MTVGRLHVVTDTSVQSRYSHIELAEMACDGGAQVIQFRDKFLEHDALVDTARRMAAICRAHGVTLVVNDRADIAHEAGADGVHLGRDDASVRDARLLLGAQAVIGGTAGNLGEALQAEAAGADYVGFGHVFATTSKQKSTPPIGVDAIARAIARVRVPIIAIGGITIANASEVLAAGAWGIAVIGAVCAADDPREATAHLRAIVDRREFAR